MRITGTIPPKVVSEVYFDEVVSVPSAVRLFRHTHENVRVEQINGHYVKAVCKCGTPIMEEDHEYYYDPVNKWQCIDCHKRIIKENNHVPCHAV